MGLKTLSVKREVKPQCAFCISYFLELEDCNIREIENGVYGKHEIRVFFLDKMSTSMRQCKIILAFDANAKLLNFTRMNMATLSCLPFALSGGH